jgi:hypothetical protein
MLLCIPPYNGENIFVSPTKIFQKGKANQLAFPFTGGGSGPRKTYDVLPLWEREPGS